MNLANVKIAFMYIQQDLLADTVNEMKSKKKMFFTAKK